MRSALGVDLRHIHIDRNVTYGRGGSTELTLDIAWPRSGNGPFPAVVLLAGGGWQYFAWPGLMEGILELLATRGYVTIEPRYRLSPATHFPAAVEDCKAAVRWLRASAGRYSVDPDRVAALGPSSGGYLACMLGLTGPADGFEGQGGHAEQSSSVQAVVNLFGISDLNDVLWREKKQKGLLTPFLGETFAENPELYRRASPVEYVRPGAPPFLIIHGDQDVSVPVGQSQRLAERLTGVGASVQLTIVPGAGHGWRPPLLLETIKQVDDYLAAQLKSSARI
jgi:acetyl esterase/lipase